MHWLQAGPQQNAGPQSDTLFTPEEVAEALRRYQHYVGAGISDSEVAPFCEDWVHNALAMLPPENRWAHGPAGVAVAARLA